MKVENNKYVAIDYVLTLDSGDEVDRSPEGSPLAFVLGAGQIIPGLEKALLGMEKGDSAKVTVEPEDGYGMVEDNLKQEIPRSQFPEDMDVQPGMQFQAQGPQGPFVFLIAEVNEDHVVADLNHPMAGQRLHFEVTINEVREPSADELNPPSQGGCGCSSDGCDSAPAADSGGGCGGGCACS